MKKPNKKNTLNLFFSAFLILAFVVCAHFFSNFALGQNQVLSNVIQLFVITVEDGERYGDVVSTNVVLLRTIIKNSIVFSYSIY